MKLWVVGMFSGNEEDIDNEMNTAADWEFIGVYNKESLAVKNCKDWRYFVGPCLLNETTEGESVEWEDSYYPIVREA